MMSSTPPQGPPDAADSPPFQWTDIGALSAGHGEILIIANLGIPAPPGPVAPDRVLGTSRFSGTRPAAYFQYYCPPKRVHATPG